MNKFAKLPLFLGICGALCSGVLAAVSHFTAPYISDKKVVQQNANVLKVLGTDTASKIETVELKDDFTYIVEIKIVYVSNEVLGVVYKGDVKEKYTDWSIQLGIKDGKYSGFEYTTGEKADAAIGIPAIEKFKADIVGKTVDTPSADINASATTIVTVPTIRKFIEECADHYSANYL